MSKGEHKNVHNETQKPPEREGKERTLLSAGVLPPNHGRSFLLPNGREVAMHGKTQSFLSAWHV